MVILRGTQKSDLEWLEGKKFQQSLHKSAQMFALQVQPVSIQASINAAAVSEPELQRLLDDYANIFLEPKTLPPCRDYDHRIVLKPGTSPINVRPYRYPALQKDVIEKTVQEMLQAGVIRPSHSPYSSPIVLEKKKDCS